jgi:subtilase family serine protease
VSRSLSMKLAALGAALVACLAYSVGGATSADAAGPSINPHRIKVFPDSVKISSNPDAAQFTCQGRPIDGSQGIVCYDPSQIQTAYGVKPLLDNGKDGTGRTIVIVDAFQNPYLASDLATFDQGFGLPAADFTNTVMPGTPAFDPNDDNQVGWGEESTLDVLWAHAIAPGAKIRLISAASNNDTDILAATQYAVDNNLGDVLSQSFGENENCVDPTLLAAEHQMFAKAKKQGWTVFASSGDSGAAQFTCDGSGAVQVASSPASDPLVTGVGGTTLAADINGTYQGETAWTEGIFTTCNPPADDDVNCSGGGFSDLYAKPSFQKSMVKGKVGRGVPDVAYNAGINGGVLTVCTVCDPSDPGGVFLFGGTSAGSPQWAGLAAIADQLAGHRLGEINTALYSIANSSSKYRSAFHDVTTGNNHVADIGGNGYDTRKGWDAVTGLGTPDAAQLLPALIKRAG